jgi:hypothetical protein
MLSKCANPHCSTPFHYLREGKLFRMEVEAPASPLETGADLHLVWDKKPSRKIEHFWLCGTCSRTLTLRMDKERRVAVVPIKAEVKRAIAS